MAAKKKTIPKKQPAKTKVANIVEVRSERVLLDRDVAELFEVEVRKLNQQVTRNKDRFVDDFAFRLEWDEFEDLRSQNVILQGWAKVTYPPMAFTEYGIVMAATVLKSDRAIEATRHIIRTFVEVRREAWEREIEKQHGQVPLALNAPSRQGLMTKLNMALGNVVDAIADPENQRKAEKEAKAIAAEGVKALKAVLASKQIDNEKRIAEIHRILAEAENIQVDTDMKRTQHEGQKLALLFKKLKLIIQAQHWAETGSPDGLMAVLSEMEQN